MADVRHRDFGYRAHHRPILGPPRPLVGERLRRRRLQGCAELLRGGVQVNVKALTDRIEVRDEFAGIAIIGTSRAREERVRRARQVRAALDFRRQPAQDREDMVRDIPTGTVTFLFTDVEGSTRLLRELGAENYAEALSQHRRVIREACATQGGVEVDTQGDAFFFSFPTAPGALVAASTLTKALAAGPIRVRVGLHTGTPFLTEDGYVGDEVHRAARICSSGHGGQVLLSATTRDLVEDHVPSGVALLDLGEHRLKDVDRPETIVQLIIEGVPPVFTPLKTLEHQPTETPFAGQEEQLAAAAAASFAAEPLYEAGGRVEGVARARALARARTLDWRGFVHLSGHTRFANRLEGLGTSIHSTARLVSRDDLRGELQRLGGAFVTAARDARSADRLLRKEDLSTLRRQLGQRREGAYLESYLRQADELAMQTAGLEGLVEARRQLEQEGRRLEPRARAIRTRVFDARLDSAKLDELLLDVRRMRVSAEELAATFHQACDRALRAFPRP